MADCARHPRGREGAGGRMPERTAECDRGIAPPTPRRRIGMYGPASLRFSSPHVGLASPGIISSLAPRDEASRFVTGALLLFPFSWPLTTYLASHTGPTSKWTGFSRTT
eukprot:scaffold6016_cov119-Isochrysis_galbana.AAC.7